MPKNINRSIKRRLREPLLDEYCHGYFVPGKLYKSKREDYLFAENGLSSDDSSKHINLRITKRNEIFLFVYYDKDEAYNFIDNLGRVVKTDALRRLFRTLDKVTD